MEDLSIYGVIVCMDNFDYKMGEWVQLYRSAPSNTAGCAYQTQWPVYGQITGVGLKPGLDMVAETYIVELHKPYPRFCDDDGVPFTHIAVEERVIQRLSEVTDPTDEELLEILTLPL